MFIVTGGAGFIGSNIVKGLNKKGYNDILVVDDLTDGKKYRNLVTCDIADYLDYQDFQQQLLQNRLFSRPVRAIFHAGACSVTTEWNGRYMMQNNYEYSKQLLHYCHEHKISFIYASSAAVYGGGNTQFTESSLQEVPLNVYGYSKWLFDQYVLRMKPQLNSQVVGLRYFNVFGPNENHKGSMASVAYHFMNQLRDNGIVKLFAGTDGYADGEQRRDFVYVDDVVNVNLWMMENPQVSGIFNVGTGQSRSFNAIAKALIAAHGAGKIEYVPFPAHLKGAYQSFTEAKIELLRKAGYTASFHTLEEALNKYYQWFFGVNQAILV